ncbi:Hsp20/alpha crystallin family protein [Halobium salinum]|uniref:Hsp20/alpha crystallin family protein n=1 Tax=Halobium salinum TaxID=1364940 RepID=A0ABD5PH27_9EURY|nr:Hsp20/alpha crystallin family protein [Halobium salinum]
MARTKRTSGATRRRGPETSRAPEPAFPIDVEEHGSEYRVAATLPGRRRQDFTVRVRKDKLQIVADGEGTERLSRIVRLPGRVDERRTSASYTDGVLWVTVGKLRRR